MVDRIPYAAGGLPANAPARPETPPEYPNPQTAPPSRSEMPLTNDEENRLRAELNALRDRQTERAGTAPPKSDAKAGKSTKRNKDAAAPRPVKDATP